MVGKPFQPAVPKSRAASLTTLLLALVLALAIPAGAHHTEAPTPLWDGARAISEFSWGHRSQAFQLDVPPGRPLLHVTAQQSDAIGIRFSLTDPAGASACSNSGSYAGCHITDPIQGRWRFLVDTQWPIYEWDDPIRFSVHTYYNPLPLARFTHDECANVVTVDAYQSSSSVGSIVEYQWTWGEAPVPEWQASTASARAIHAYTRPGTYTIHLAVTDERGEVGWAAATVKILAVKTPLLPPSGGPPVSAGSCAAP